MTFIAEGSEDSPPLIYGVLFGQRVTMEYQRWDTEGVHTVFSVMIFHCGAKPERTAH